MKIQNEKKILPPSFYARATIMVAIDLLGKILWHKTPKGVLSGKIVEVEAYLGEIDPACHAFSGKTRRTKIFWGYPGIAYVFLNYGIHHCFNVITEEPSIPGCVLLRSLQPLMGIPVMKENRSTNNLFLLTNGPGKLTKAMGITRSHNGTDLTQGDLLILDNSDGFNITVTSRIGISKAETEPLRFYIDHNPFVSCLNGSSKLLGGPRDFIRDAFSNGTIKVSLQRKNLSTQIPLI